MIKGCQRSKTLIKLATCVTLTELIIMNEERDIERGGYKEDTDVQCL